MTQLHTLTFGDLQINHGELSAGILQLMNDFYSVTDRLSRPRVFGFASCNAKFDEGQIEVPMDSKLLDLATELSTERPSREETVLLYDKMTEPTKTTLFQELQPLISSQPCFEQLLGDSKHVLEDLGPCASDLVWRRALKESSALRTDHDPKEKSINVVQTRVRDLIKNWTFAMPNLDPSSQSFNEISPTLAAKVYNLIVILEEDATRVAAAEVSILIRFDALESLEAGHKFTYGCETHLIHMVERNRGNFQQNVSSSISDEPQATILKLPHLTVEKDLAADGDPGFIQDPTTGSLINLDNAVEAVGRISSRLPAKSVKTLFHVEKKQAHHHFPPSFVCTVVIPGILNAAGPARNSEDIAKRAACYAICQNLASKGLLDCRFFPQPEAIAADYTSPPDAEKSGGGQRSYTRKEPDFWTNTRGIPIGSLYPVVISTMHRDADMQPYAPISILTRQALPDLASFKVFFSGVPATISMQRGAPLRLTEGQIQELYLYTLRTCRIVTNKSIECPLANMVYFIAPLRLNWSPADDDAFNRPNELPSIAEYIPWELVSLAAHGYSVSFKRGVTTEEAQRDLHDAVIQDRTVEFTKRYAAVRLRNDLSPLSKPTDSPREALFDSILAHCKARRKGFEGLRDENQPLIEVTSLPPVLNQLNPASRPSTTTKLQAKYLIPELCSKCTIPASTMRTMRLLPSITRRIDDLLLVKELNARLFDHAISDTLLHTAITTPSCGIEFDYERLEILGDAFLKYVSSIYLYVSWPEKTEGELHSARQDLISNKSLFKRACRTGLPTYIQSKLLSPRTWAPPNFTKVVEPRSSSNGTMSAKPMVTKDAPAAAGKAKASRVQQEPEDGEIDDKESPALTPMNKGKQPRRRGARGKGDPTKHWLGDKAVADVAEALIAAGYSAGGEDLGLKVVKAIGVPISLDIRAWADFRKRAAPILKNPLRKQKPETLKAVEAIIGYKIAQPHLLGHVLVRLLSLDGNANN
ncbi:hypothetical protein DXG03_009155 [Asterophora parasitica]|uniref:RNase III domain-containing protein n=1 Tax=Asterophora parasitica TaxID=117018 RepID=A0A9P7GB59_9AGAR|nr:hypothetical protein DXG03_009155 [Asterophora parasitica]